MIHDILLVALWLASALGCLFMLFAAALMWSSTRPQPATEPAPDLTILKPLYRCEPGLFENLESFCRQDYGGPVQIVFGVHDEADPAVAVVEGAAGEISADGGEVVSNRSMAPTPRSPT